MEILSEEMTIFGLLRTLEMESYSQFTDQYVLAVSSRLNAMSKRGSNLTDFKVMARKVNIYATKQSLFFALLNSVLNWWVGRSEHANMLARRYSRENKRDVPLSLGRLYAKTSHAIKRTVLQPA